MLAGVLVDNLVGGDAVLEHGLRRAALHVLRLHRGRAFNAIADHQAADDAEHRGCGASTSVANGVAYGTTRNGTQGCSRPGLLPADLLELHAAHLARNLELRDDR